MLSQPLSSRTGACLPTIVAPGDGPSQRFDATTIIAAPGSAGVFTAVVTIVQAYLQRNRGRKATIEFKGHKLQLDGYNGAEIERIVHELQSKH